MAAFLPDMGRQGFESSETQQTVEPLLEHLQEFGLDAKEAKVYLTLIALGPSKATSVAAQAGLARVDAYRTLTRLMERGIVQATLHRPMKFVAASLDQALEALVAMHRSVANRLEKKKEELASVWMKTQTRPVEGEAERFTVLKGRSQFFISLRALLSRATRTVSLNTTRNGLIRLYNATIDEDFEKARARGVKLRFLCPVDRSYADILQRFASLGEVHHNEDAGGGQFVVADGTEAIVSAFVDDSLRLRTPADTHLWSNSKGFATSTQTFFDELWGSTADHDTVLRAAMAGKPVPTLRVISGEPELHQKVEELLSGCVRRLDALVGQVGATWLFQPQRVEQLAALRGRQVTLSLLVHETPSNLSLSEQVCEQFDVKHFEAGFDGIFLLADDASVLVVEIPTDDRKEPPSPKAGFFTNETNFVHSMKLLFNQLWTGAQVGSRRVKELQSQKRALSLVEACAAALTEKGYAVERPGRLPGRLNAEHAFSLVARARNDSGRVMTLDVLVDSTPLDSVAVAQTCAKRSDITAWRSLLIVEPGVHVAGRGLADFYGVELIQGIKDRDVLEQFRRVMGERRMEVSVPVR
jgi:sugar-specific transcriptional regulator TrmB